MADGTTDAPTPPFREKREMVPVEFTKKFDSYGSMDGPRFNAGERASLPKAEAERLIHNGAAVRQTDDPVSTAHGKGTAHPPKDKMQQTVLTK